MATRREFLAATATASAVAAFAWPRRGEQVGQQARRTSSLPLRPVPDQTTGALLLKLPPDFTYKSFSWSLDVMDDGNVVSGLPDGMGAFPASDERTVTLVRNHEISLGHLLGESPVYDPKCGGGTTTLTFDLHRGEWLTSRVSLAGTYKNCAGGPTPWGSWLSCEETLADPTTDAVHKPHGYVFEVPAAGVGDPRPITGLGRFRHEAAAVDAATGTVYLTEDERRAGLYRFLPGESGSLRGAGRLQMLAVEDHPNFNGRVSPDVALPVAWVNIDDPQAVDGSVFDQGYDNGGMRFKRLEGCWLEGDHLYFVATTGGRAGKGQIWELAVAEERLRLLYESPGRSTLDMPDNLIAMPDGALLLCEDGGAPCRLRLLTPGGELTVVAENNIVLDGLKGMHGDYRGGEWCGVCRAGDWLFANVQEPGITFAITGPWDELAKAARA